MELLHTITGWNNAVHSGLKALALMKFGENPRKGPKDITSWAPVNDDYANRLLDKLVGAIQYRTQQSRIIHKVLIQRELYKYIMTGEKDEVLISSIEKCDRYYWCDRSEMKLLPSC